MTPIRNEVSTARTEQVQARQIAAVASPAMIEKIAGPSANDNERAQIAKEIPQFQAAVGYDAAVLSDNDRLTQTMKQTAPTLARVIEERAEVSGGLSRAVTPIRNEVSTARTEQVQARQIAAVASPAMTLAAIKGANAANDYELKVIQENEIPSLQNAIANDAPNANIQSLLQEKAPTLNNVLSRSEGARNNLLRLIPKLSSSTNLQQEESGIILSVINRIRDAKVVNELRSAGVSSNVIQKMENHLILGNEFTTLEEAKRVIPELDNADTLALLKKTGGIDFRVRSINLQIKRDGKGVPIPLQLQDVKNINIEGLYPVIINITPATFQSLPLLGQKEKKEAVPQLSKK